MEKSGPNYKRIFEDIISKKCPEKYHLCAHLLNKSEISAMDVLTLNDIVFDKNRASDSTSQKHKSYDSNTINTILEYQKKNKLSNTEVSRHFNLSRSTVSKWKKAFLPERIDNSVGLL
ncbi:DNA-binding transcriptional regulator YiaG [Chryseobacterium sp. SLBN-27]|uniref:helix-turn-helix domain-containing protein n=1 Tax=Chryseobacterium sp. SLBN-27 TaxID=3042287 RepID=UPI0028649F4E|nr:helix-turn-helix domain-containing protein [Chryseobacterium sp. SLBN-27]MDR6156807.1 DNA-binding transcriptional regulator YiaG [Chryseobacterium sp. SLBN-27]